MPQVLRFLDRLGRTSHMNKPLLFSIFKTPNRQVAYTLLPFLGTVPLTSQIIPVVTFRIPHKRVKSVYCLATDWTTGVRSPATAKWFFPLASVSRPAEAHPASYPMGTGAQFPGVKRGRGVTLTTHPHIVPRPRMNTSYITSPPWRLRGVAAQL
jgi:hypothetical protein